MDRRVHNDEVSEELVRSTPGNASIDIKALMHRWLRVFTQYGFGTRSVRGLEIVEVSILPQDEEPTGRAARVVLEMTVTEDMLNAAGTIHGACIAHLVDICTTLPIAAMTYVQGGKSLAGVSQSIDILYHAPASLGDKLKLINTSTTVDTHVWSARIEIWDVTHRRLVASATQVKMEASSSKL